MTATAEQQLDWRRNMYRQKIVGRRLAWKNNPSAKGKSVTFKDQVGTPLPAIINPESNSTTEKLDKAGQIASARRLKSIEKDDTNKRENEDSKIGLKQAQLTAKKQGRIKAAASKVKGAITSPSVKGTAWLLRICWLNAIDSVGLTLIPINFIAMLHVLFPSMVCGLGEEWMMNKVPNTPETEAAKKMAKIGEGGLVLLVDLMVVLLILMNIAMFMVVYDALSGVMGWFYITFFL